MAIDLEELKLRNQLIEKYAGKKVKANLLERLLALPLALGSIPDVIYDKDLLEYPRNIVRATKTLFKGKKYDPPKTTTDLLRKANILQGSSLPEKTANFVLSLAGDIALDPTMFLGVGKGAKGAEKLVAGLPGKEAITLVDNPTVAHVVNSLINPIGEGVTLSARGMRKVAPSQMAKIEEIFNKMFRLGKTSEKFQGFSDDLKVLFTALPEEQDRLWILGAVEEAKKKGPKAVKELAQKLHSLAKSKLLKDFGEIKKVSDKDTARLLLKAELAKELDPEKINQVVEANLAKKQKAYDTKIAQSEERFLGATEAQKLEVDNLRQRIAKNNEVLMDPEVKGKLRSAYADDNRELARRLRLVENEIADTNAIKVAPGEVEDPFKKSGKEIKKVKGLPSNNTIGIINPNVIKKSKVEIIPEDFDIKSIIRDPEEVAKIKKEWNKGYSERLKKEIPERELQDLRILDAENDITSEMLKEVEDELVFNEQGIPVNKKYLLGDEDVWNIVNKSTFKNLSPTEKYTELLLKGVPSEKADGYAKNLVQGLKHKPATDDLVAQLFLYQSGDANAAKELLRPFVYDINNEAKKLASKYKKTKVVDLNAKLDSQNFIVERLLKQLKDKPAENFAKGEHLYNYGKSIFRTIDRDYGRSVDTVAQQLGKKTGLGSTAEFIEETVYDEYGKKGANTSDDFSALVGSATKANNKINPGLLKTSIEEAKKAKGLSALVKQSDNINKIVKDSNIGYMGTREVYEMFGKHILEPLDLTKSPQNQLQQAFEKFVYAHRMNTTMKMEDFIRKFKFADGTSFAIKTKKLPKDYMWVSGVSGLEGYAIPKEGGRLLKNYYEAFNPEQTANVLLNSYDRLQQWWKSFVTTKSPWVIGYGIRNMIGDNINIMLGGFGGGNPSKMIQSWSDGKKVMDLMGEMMNTNLINKEAHTAFVEKWNKQKIHGIGMYDWIKRSYDYSILNSKFNQIADNLSRPMNTKLIEGSGFWDKYIVTPMEWRENWTRVSNFIDAYGRFGDMKKAAQHAKLTSLDFGNLTAFERKVMKRVVPFYGFLRANLEAQIKMYNQDPRRFIFMQRTFDNLKRAFSDKGITEEEWDNMPDWIKNGIVLPISKSDKGNIKIMTGFGEPTHVYNEILQFDSPEEFIGGLMSTVNPIIKLPIELLTNYSFHAGDKISNLVRGSAWKDMPKPIKDLLDYKSTGTITDKYGNTVKSPVVDPFKSYLATNMPFLAPLVIQGKRAVEATKDIDQLVNLTGLLGGKIRTRNVFADRRIADKESLDAAEQILTQLGAR